MNNDCLIQVESFKFLGLHIDHELTWKYHINYLSKMLSRNTGILNKLKHFFPKYILKNLYSTLILPYLCYGILAWGNCAKLYIDKIFKLQKRAIRSVNLADYYCHTNDFFFENRLLKVADLFLYNLGTFMFQLSANGLPDVFTHMFQKNYAVHAYPTRQRESFHLPRTRTLLAQKTIVFTGPKFWNDLPADLINCSSMFTFKQKLKLMLINEYNQSD